MRHKTYLLTFLWVLLTFSALAQQTTRQQKKDSLRLLIERTDGEERSRALQQLASLYLPELPDAEIQDTILAIYDRVEAEADSMGNVKVRELTKLNKLNVFFNSNLYDELIERAPWVLASIAENKQWKYYYQAANLVVEAHRRKGNLEKALEAAKKFYEEAKERNDRSGMGMAQLSLGKIYSSQQRFAEAEKCNRECIDLLEGETVYLNYLPTAYNRLTYSLVGQERYDEALEVARATETVNRRYEEASRSPQPSCWYNLWLTYIDIYRQNGSFADAQTYINKVDSITRGSVKLYKERGHVLYGLGRYTEALEMLDKAIAASPKGIEEKGLKLMTLAQMREPQKTVELFSEVIAQMDSTRNETFNAQLDEVRTQYEVDKYIAQRERNRLYFLFALGGCILLALLLGVTFYYNRLITRKNIGLYKRIKEQDRLEEELVQTRELLMRQNEKTVETELASGSEVDNMLSPDKQQRELVSQLYTYLIQNDNLVRVELNREELIVALNTNKNALSTAVKAVTGKTPMEYIRTIQLSEARRLLDGHPEMTVESIAFNCGFSTPSTFYRLFRKQYGFGPSDYRKAAKRQAEEE